MFLQILLLCWFIALLSSSAALVVQTKPGCEANCGNVSIPYPFGIGNGCSADASVFGDDYNIRCDTSYNPPKPFIGNGTSLEIVSISDTEIRIRPRPQSAVACYNENQSRSRSAFEINLLETSFSFSYTKNLVFGVGCDTLIVSRPYINNSNYTETTCISECESRDQVMEGSCSGRGCCNITIPRGVKRFFAGVSSIMNQTRVRSFNPCSYAFIGDQEQYKFQASDLLRKDVDVPVVLDWALGESTCGQARESNSSQFNSFVCQNNSHCMDAGNNAGYHCVCNEGYEGNPYLEPGCQEVNDCQTSRGCTVVKKDGFPVMKVSLGVGLGLLLFSVLVSYCLYLAIKKRKLQNQIPSHKGVVEPTKIFTAEELKLATNNYDENRILGRGGYGTVYMGTLSNNQLVAIKKSKVIEDSQIEQFRNEVIILSQINHRNVVKLLGYCFETEVPLLVYEYISNGTLYQHIHYTGEGMSPLSWDIRLRIAAETADALAYLHSAASIPIIHRDIKSANILLDENYTTKVSDFGASRFIPLDQSRLNTLVQGTLGYLDPEYFNTSELTDKSDVYSFGVVLVELLTGQKPISFERSEEQRNLATYFLS